MVVKLIDFGLCADTTDKSDTTLLKDRAGTVCYLAPELIECNPKKGYYGPKVDVFSIAMVFWELLTGKNPIRVPRRRGEPRSKSKEYRYRKYYMISRVIEVIMFSYHFSCIWSYIS